MLRGTKWFIWTGFGESNDEKWVAACSQTMGKDGMKMKAWNEDDQLGQYIEWMCFGQCWMKQMQVTIGGWKQGSTIIKCGRLVLHGVFSPRQTILFFLTKNLDYLKFFLGKNCKF
jgi:hypothetical protein